MPFALRVSRVDYIYYSFTLCEIILPSFVLKVKLTKFETDYFILDLIRLEKIISFKTSLGQIIYLVQRAAFGHYLINKILFIIIEKEEEKRHVLTEIAGPGPDLPLKTYAHSGAPPTKH